MNSEDLLFTNTFIEIPDERVANNKTRNENFRKFYESSKAKGKEKETPPQQQREDLSRKTEKTSVVVLDTKDRDTNKFPNQNDFTSFLGKTFFNVKSIKLVSTEIPNTDTVIKDLPVELKNNVIAWTNQEDVNLGLFTNCFVKTSVEDYIDITVIDHPLTIGEKKNVIFFNGKKNTDLIVTGYLDGTREVTAISDSVVRIKYLGGNAFEGTISADFGIPVYSVEIKSGNYTASTITEKIAASLNTVKRRNGKGQYHYFEVGLNLDTDIIYMDSVITRQLPNNSIATTAGSTTITVNSLAHGFKTGDRVKMIGVKSTAGILSSVLNGDFLVTVLDFNTFTYEINERAIDTVAGGGNVIKTGTNAPFRLLFSSEQTKIQYNIGFPNEDSSIYIGKDSPITTRSLSIQNAQRLNSSTIRITTTVDHLLYESNKTQITSITTASGNYILVITGTDHGIDVPQIVTLRNTNCTPDINGPVLVEPMGPTAFSITSKTIKLPGSSGQVIFGGDSVKISGLLTAPRLVPESVYFVENITASNQFDITANVLDIDLNSIQYSSVNTEQIKVDHPGHLFNKIVLVEGYTSTTTVCKTFLPHPYIGTITDNLNIIAGPVNTNTIDIISHYHGLATSDEVIILNSTSNPTIDGTYKIQVVDDNTFRINFVYASLVPGTCTVVTGDNVRIAQTNSMPRINGEFNISNRFVISSIDPGSIVSVITLTNPHPDWKPGDQITITGSDSNPSIDGIHYIQTILSTTSFTIDIAQDVLVAGTIGAVVNNVRFLAKTETDILTSGTYGILGRNQEISFYRVSPEVKTTDNIGGILTNALNNFPRNILSIIDEDSYYIRAKGSYSTSTVTSGGYITVSSILHGNRSIQYNTKTGDNTTNLFRSISLQGENYLYLVCQGLGTIINSSGISDVFAKLLLSSSAGEMVYNSFVSSPKIFDPPIAKLDTLKFSVLTSTGYLFNFNDINYSFSLEIVELVDGLKNSEISSRTGNTQYDNNTNSNSFAGVDKNKDLLITSKSGKQDSGYSAGVGFVRAEGARGGSFR